MLTCHAQSPADQAASPTRRLVMQMPPRWPASAVEYADAAQSSWLTSLTTCRPATVVRAAGRRPAPWLGSTGCFALDRPWAQAWRGHRGPGRGLLCSLLLGRLQVCPFGSAGFRAELSVAPGHGICSMLLAHASAERRGIQLVGPFMCCSIICERLLDGTCTKHMQVLSQK